MGRKKLKEKGERLNIYFPVGKVKIIKKYSKLKGFKKYSHFINFCIDKELKC